MTDGTKCGKQCGLTLNAENNSPIDIDGNFYTDMAIESFEADYAHLIKTKDLGEGVLKSVTKIITAADEKKFGKQKGIYITFDLRRHFLKYPDTKKTLTSALASTLKELSAPFLKSLSKTATAFKKTCSVLVVGLGNEGMTADSLGPKCVERILVDPENLRTLCTLAPGVRGVTGIESFDVIKGVVDRISPDLVIAVDTLASRRASRLFSSFQLTTAGIVPGGGVGNHKQPLTLQSLGVPVIAIGVPLVLYARSLISESLSTCLFSLGISLTPSELGIAVSNCLAGSFNLVVTPKEIDLIADGCADVIAAALNKCFAR